MAKLGSLFLDLIARTGAFDSSLDKSRRNARRFGKDSGHAMRDLQRSMSTLKHAAFGLVGVGGFGALIKSSIDTADSLAKTADKLGTTTQGLAGLRHAAELSGVASNTLDMALQRMTRRLAEAASGTGEAKGALKELGLDARALANAGPEEAFRQIAGAMQNVESQSDRVRLAFKLFDSEGVALVNTLQMGEEGLSAAADEAKRLGIAMSRENVDKLVAAQDALTRMKAAGMGVANMLSVELAPAFTAVADAAPDVGKWVGKLITGFTKFGQAIGGVAAGMVLMAQGEFAMAKAAIKAMLDDIFSHGPMEIDIEPGKAPKGLPGFDPLGGLNEEDIRNRMQALQEGLFTEEEQLALSYARRAELVGNALQFRILSEQQARDTLLQLEDDYQRNRTALERKHSEQLMSMRSDLLGNSVQLLSVFANKSKTAALAIIAIQKAQGIAQTIINTQVAAMRALAELGPIAGPPMAAKIQAMGAASVGLIAATGLAEAVALNRGQGGVSTPTGTFDADPVSGLPVDNRRGGTTEIRVIGGPGIVYSSETMDQLIDNMREAIDRGDRILISRESRQALELRTT